MCMFTPSCVTLLSACLRPCSMPSSLKLLAYRSQKFLDDAFYLDVSSIVGPPYAIYKLLPCEGPMTGHTDMTIVGEDFKNGSIKVTFTDGKNTEIVEGKFVSKTKLSCKSPDWQKYSAGEINVRVNIAGEGYLPNSSSMFQTLVLDPPRVVFWPSHPCTRRCSQAHRQYCQMDLLCQHQPAQVRRLWHGTLRGGQLRVGIPRNLQSAGQGQQREEPQHWRRDCLLETPGAIPRTSGVVRGRGHPGSACDKTLMFLSKRHFPLHTICIICVHHVKIDLHDRCGWRTWATARTT